MDTSAPYHDHLARQGPAVPYMVSVLLEQPPRLDPDDLLAALRTRVGTCEPLPVADAARATSELISTTLPAGSGDDDDDPVILVVQFPEWPEVTIAVLAFDHPDDPANLRHAVTQTWDWPEAGAVVNAHSACVVVTDVPDPASAVTVPRAIRLDVVAGAVRSVIDVLPVTAATAIHWMPAQRVIDPGHWVAAADAGGALDASAVNVRLFQLGGGKPGETVMDTFGLAAFGLPDLQCHFIGLDANEVGHALLNYAGYLFHNGDVIKDGDSVAGLPARGSEADVTWMARREPSLIAPEREVIDLVPGEASPMWPGPGPGPTGGSA